MMKYHMNDLDFSSIHDMSKTRDDLQGTQNDKWQSKAKVQFWST